MPDDPPRPTLSEERIAREPRPSLAQDNAPVWRDLVDRMLAARGIADEPRWGGGVVLLGAGCSVSAGIPGAGGVVDLALRYLAKRRLPAGEAANPDGRALFDALRKKGLELAGEYGAELYHPLFEGPLRDRQAQQAIIQEAIEQGKERLNWAHLRLGHLVRERYFHTVLTTNFDQLALEGLIRCGVLPAVADGLEALNRLSDSPRWPQLVHLHGSRHSYQLLNSRDAVDGVAAHPVGRVMLPRFLSAARFLLIVGYSASDNGVRDLLADALKGFPDLPVFWAVRGDAPPERVALLRKLHAGCIHLLLGQDADALFDALAQAAGLGRPPWAETPVQLLQAEAARIAEPEKLDAVSRLIADHKAELAALEARLTELRAGASPAATRERALDDLLVAGAFDEAYGLLESAAPAAAAADWLRLAEAAGRAVTESYRLAAGGTLEKALEKALAAAGDAVALGPWPLWHAGTALASLGRGAVAQKAFLRMASESRRAASKTAQRNLAVALDELGELARERGDGAEAARLHGESLDIRRRLATQLGTPQAQRDLSVSLSRLGDLAGERGEGAEAARLHGESLDIGRLLAVQLGTPEAQRDLSVSLSRLGDLARERGEGAEAARLHGESLDIARQMATQLGTPEAQRVLSVSLIKLGDLARERGDRGEAARLHGESLDIARQMATQMGTPQAQRDLSVSLERLGDLARDRGDGAEAARLHGESLDIARRLTAQLGTPQAWADLVIYAGHVAEGTAPGARGALLDEADAALVRAGDGLPSARRSALASWLAGLRGQKAVAPRPKRKKPG